MWRTRPAAGGGSSRSPKPRCSHWRSGAGLVLLAMRTNLLAAALALLTLVSYNVITRP
jgi:hypothetical protein